MRNDASTLVLGHWRHDMREREEETESQSAVILVKTRDSGRISGIGDINSSAQCIEDSATREDASSRLGKLCALK